MTVVEDTPTTQEPQPPEALAEKPTAVLFQYSKWIHLGPDAEECDKRFSGKCEDDQHFHAWIRLPNPFQIKDIGEKARAAMARRKRMLRDPEADLHAILELELDELRATDDKDGLVYEIVDRDFESDYLDAVREIEDIESEEPMPEDADEDWKPQKVYAHILQDREELRRMEALPEDQRDAEEFEHLKAHLRSYEEKVREAVQRRQETKREALLTRPWDDLLKMVREDRIESMAQEAYIQTFNMWQWFVCTFKPRPKGTPNERVWGDVNQMRLEAPPEVIEALRDGFRSLEDKLARSRQAGNS